MKKRIFSLLLVVCMVVSLLPANIFHVHADTVTKKPFYLVNGSAITGSTTNSYNMPKTWTRETSVKAGEWPQVYFLNHTDAAASAQALWELFKDRPEGTRYFELEVAPAVFIELVEDRVYYSDAAEVTKMWLEAFLAEYSKIGGVLDGIAVDLEYHGSHTYSGYLGAYYKANYDGVNANTDVVYNIVNDEEYPALRKRLLDLGFDFDLAAGSVPEIATAFSWYPGATLSDTNNKIWNQVMDEMERDYINECAMEPLLRYYPDAIISNYQSATLRSYNESLVWNGKPEFYDNIYPAGNATSMNAYSGRGRGVDTAPDGYLNAAGWSKTSAFNSALFEVKFAKDMLATSQDVYGIDKQHIWVGGYSYGRVHEYSGSDLYEDNDGYKDYVYDGSYSETPYYAETMFHLGLTTDEPFLGYIIENEETKREGYGGVGYQACIEIFDGILQELTAVAGTSDRKPIRTDANWNGSYILSGMYAGGRNIWRLTPDEAQLTAEGKTLSTFKVEGADPTFKIDGLTISFPGGRVVETGIKIEGTLSDGTKKEAGTCGYWVETAANVEPVIVADDNRYAASSRYNSVVADNEITTNIKLYDTVIGEDVENGTSAADADYRVSWINAIDANKKGVIKANGVRVATFNAPKGQDGAAVGTIDVSKLGISGNVTLTVTYEDYTPENPSGEIDENFYQNYIDDSHAVITVPGVGEIAFNEGEAAKYYTTSNGVAAAGTSSNYNIKVEYPKDGMATVTLKGANLTKADGAALEIGNATYKNFNLKIVVEEDSTLSVTSGSYAAIEGMMNGSLTITGAGKLTLSSAAYSAVHTSYKLILKNANIDASTDASGFAAIWSQYADIVIDRSTVKLDAAGGSCLFIGAVNGYYGDYGVTIKNGSNVSAFSYATELATIGCLGDVTIDDSYVYLHSANKVLFAPGSDVALTNIHAHAGNAPSPTTVWDGVTGYQYFEATCETKITVAEKVATCTTAGNTAEIRCSHCDALLSASVTIEAKGHNFITRTENYVPADTVNPGSYDLVTICTECDHESSRVPVEIPVPGVAPSVTFSSYQYHSDASYIGQNANGSWKAGMTLDVEMAEGGADRYYLTRRISADNPNIVLTTEGASAVNYNVKFSWPAGGQPTVYLKNANMISTSAPLTIKGGTIPVTVVVEKDSQLIALDDYTSATAINSTGTGLLTITSKNNAKLEAIAEENVAISTGGDLTLKSANVVAKGGTVGGNAGANYGSIRTSNADFTVDNSTLYMTVRTSGFLSNTKNWNIINSSDVTALTIVKKSPNMAMISVSGDVMINSSSVKFYSFTGTAQQAGDRMFAKAPVLRGVTAKGGSWTGVNLTGESYNAAYEEIKTYAADYNKAHLLGYTYFETTACEHKTELEENKATCTKRAVCDICGLSYGPDPSHTYTVIDCTADTKCIVCNETVVTAVNAHTEVADAAIAPTCTIDGLTAGSHCSVCNKILVAQLVVPATGHTEVRTEGKDATCYEDGYTSGISCSVCDEVIKPVEVLKKGHTVVVDPAVDPTCTEPGLSKGSHCSVCNIVIDPQSVTPELGHTAGTPEKVVTKRATCTETGTYDLVTKCTVCGDELDRETGFVIEKLPHKLTYSKQTIEDVVKNVFTCADCGHVEDSMTYDYVDYGANSAYLQFYDANKIVKYSYFTTNEPYYLRTVDGFVTEVDADEYNYNIKAVFADEKLTIYLRDAEIYDELRCPPMVIGAYTEEDGYIYDFPVDIIVEGDSAITVAGSTRGSNSSNAINNLSTGLLTISSVNNAKLTLQSISANGDTTTGVTLDSVGSVKLENTNVELSNVYQNQALYIGSNTVSSDLEVIDSKLTVTTNNQNASNAIRLAGSDGDVTITNSQVTVKMNNHAQYASAIYMLGEFNINRSDVEINVNKVPFEKTPTIDANTTAKYGQYTFNVANKDYTYAGGQTFSSVHSGYMGHFKAVHTCLAGDVVHEAPEHPCDEYMQDVTYCVVCGVEMSRVEQGTTPNENKVAHTDGEPVRVDSDAGDGSYYMVTYCTVCGIETDRGELITPPTPKTVQIYLRGVAYNITDNGEPRYFVTDAETGVVNEITENVENYNIKLVYQSEGNRVWVHLKDAYIYSSSSISDAGLGIGKTGSENLDFACTVVVESASTIEVYNSLGAIAARNTGGLTITSDNNEKTDLLTLFPTNSGNALSSQCDTLIKDVHLNFTNGFVSSGSTIWVNGDLTFDGVTAHLVAGVVPPAKYTLNTIILLSAASNSLSDNDYDLTFKNSVITTQVYNGGPNSVDLAALRHGGNLYIERSDIAIDANYYAICKTPYLDYVNAEYGSYSLGAAGTNTSYDKYALAETPGESVSGSIIGGFMTTHVCGGATEFKYELPKVACGEYYDAVYYCANCGEEYHREQSDAKLPADQIAAQHTPGEPEKVIIEAATAESNGSYKMVTKCTVCNKVLHESDPVTIYGAKTGYVKIGTTGVTINNDGNARYYTVSGSTAAEITDPALYNTYNVKVEFPNADTEGNENNTVYVYLNNNLALDVRTSTYSRALDIGSATYNDFACHIIVESASSITGNGGGGDAGAIHSFITGGLTISSVNDALLTLTGANGSTLSSTACDLTLKNANIVMNNTYAANIWVKGNLWIENTTLQLVAKSGSVSRQICLGSAYNSFGAYDLTVKNSTVTSDYKAGGAIPVWDFGGTFTIERSDVSIAANRYPFRYGPYYPDYSNVETPVYSEYVDGTKNNLTFETGEDLTATYDSKSANHYGIATFTITHICGGEPVLTEPAPEAVCARYYLLVTNCEMCGKHLSTVESDVVYNENPADHVAGEPVKENVVGDTYDLVTRCVNCGEQIGESVHCTNANTIVTATFKGVSLNVKKNDEFVYYTVGDTGKLAELTGDAISGYNLKAIFRSAENKLYIYFNGLTVDVATGSTKCLEIGSSSDKSFAAEIIVETTSSLRGAGSSGTAGAINSVVTEGLTIRSANSDAKLTMYTNNSTPLMSLGCDLALVNANIEIQDKYYAAIRVVGDLLIDSSNLNLVMVENTGIDYVILLSSNYNGTDTTTNGNITVINSTVTSGLISGNARNMPVWGFGGKLTVERSDVEIRANNKAFSTNPYVTDGTHSEIKVADYATATGNGTLSNYDTTQGGVASSIGYFKSTHVCGGNVTVTDAIDHDCEQYEIHEITCAVYGCTSGYTGTETVKVVETPTAEHVWNAGTETGNRQDATTTEEGYVEYTYTCTVCGDTKTEQETIPVLSSTYFQYYTSAHGLATDDVIEGDTLYYVAETKTETHSKGNMDFTYLATTEDTVNWNVKIEYVDGVPTMYLKELDLNNCVGLVFGGKISDANSCSTVTCGTSDLKIVVLENSSICKANDSGGYWSNGNMWHHPSLNLLTTGKTTITGEVGKILSLSSTNDRGLKSILQAYGDLVVENVTLDFPASVAYDGGTNCAIAVSNGDLTVSGATVNVQYTVKIDRLFSITGDGNGNGGNLIITEGATVTNTKASSINSGVSNGVVYTTGNVSVDSDCNVSLTAYYRLFSNVPVINGYCTHTNVTASNLATVTDFAVTPAACPHANLTAHEAIAPNCSEDGNSAYWYCNDCYKYFSNADATVEIDEGDWILKADGNHVHGENWVKLQDTVVDATCNSKGSYQLANMCTKCGIYEFVEDRKTVEIPVNNKGHVWVEVDGTRVEPTAQAFGSATFKCEKCGTTKTDRIAAKFYGTNVDLGNSLDMNFYFRSDLDVDYGKAVIVRTYANGLTDMIEVDLSTCPTSGKYFVIKYTGIAAKEMCDEVTVTIYDAEGNAISESKTESIKSYALRVLDKYTADSDANAEIRTLIADMLNYGAAMQKYFSYDVTNLASAGVAICAERAEVTAAEFINNQKSSNNSYYGASFTMKSDISMNLYVLAESIDANGKAVVTYTNFKGVEKSVTITESTLVGRYYMFNLDTLIVADARQSLNIKFYDAYGNLIVDVTESMACYMDRWADSNVENASSYANDVMKFTDSATAYLTK